MPLLSPGILHRTNAPVITEQIVQKGPWVREIFILRWSVGRGRKGRDKPILRHEQWEAEGSEWSVHKGKMATKIRHPRLLLFRCLILDQRWGAGKRVCLKINLLEFRVCLRSNQSKGEKLIVNASRRIEKPSMTTEKQVLTARVMLQRGRDEPEALARSISFYAIPEFPVCPKTPSGHLSTCPSLCYQAPQKQFSLRTPHFVSSTPIILWHFSSHRGDFDSLFTKSSGTWSSSFLAPQHHWEQMGFIWCLPHLTFSCFCSSFREINFRPISFAFHLHNSGVQHSASLSLLFSLYCVYLAAVSHDSFRDDFKTFNSCSRPHL